MYIGYCMLNKSTRLDRYSILQIYDLIDHLASTIKFSEIDLAKTYHQVLTAEGHQYKMAVSL